MLNVLPVFCGFFLTVQRNRHCVRCGTSGLDHRNRLAHRGTRGDHIIDDQHPIPHRGAHQRTTLAVVLGFLAIVGKGHIATEARQFDGHGGGQRDAFVGWPEQHVERQT